MILDFRLNPGKVLLYGSLYSSVDHYFPVINAQYGTFAVSSKVGLYSLTQFFQCLFEFHISGFIHQLDAQESVFIIEIEQSSIVFRDSLSLSHTNNEWFISMECGCIVLHTLLDARPGGASFIDSVCIVNPEIKNAVTEHVKIYL